MFASVPNSDLVLTASLHSSISVYFTYSAPDTLLESEKREIKEPVNVLETPII